MRQWENFCRVCGRHRSFTRGIEGGKEIDEGGDQTEMGFAALWNPEAETSSKKRPENKLLRDAGGRGYGVLTRPSEGM